MNDKQHVLKFVANSQRILALSSHFQTRPTKPTIITPNLIFLHNMTIQTIYLYIYWSFKKNIWEVKKKAGDGGARSIDAKLPEKFWAEKVKAAFQTTGDGGYRVHLSGDPSTFQPEATYTLR